MEHVQSLNSQKHELYAEHVQMPGRNLQMRAHRGERINERVRLLLPPEHNGGGRAAGLHQLKREKDESRERLITLMIPLL